MTKRDKVTVDDIIGIVHTDETTNSVEEVKKLRGRNERFMVDTAGTLIDMETRNTYDYVSELLPLLNEQNNAINELINSEKYWEKKATQRINEITKENEQLKTQLSQLAQSNREGVEKVQKLSYENEQLKKFESTGEHIRLSINIETGELQRHIYATGQWFGDFDRVLVKNWIDEDNYQRFIDRVIEVYNNEFKKELQRND